LGKREKVREGRTYTVRGKGGKKGGGGERTLLLHVAKRGENCAIGAGGKVKGTNARGGGEGEKGGTHFGGRKALKRWGKGWRERGGENHPILQGGYQQSETEVFKSEQEGEKKGEKERCFFD